MYIDFMIDDRNFDLINKLINKFKERDIFDRSYIEKIQRIYAFYKNNYGKELPTNKINPSELTIYIQIIWKILCIECYIYTIIENDFDEQSIMEVTLEKLLK